MNIEIVEKTCPNGATRPPMVLVHGAWHGAWCWEGNFLEYFPARGWNTYAISFRGHGRSDGKEQLRWASLEDYVSDLKRLTEKLDRPPILVGHSMGGFVVQKYIEAEKAAGAVLLASAPTCGILGGNLRIIRRHPLIWLTANLLLSPYLIIGKPALAKEWFFSSTIAPDALKAHFSKLQDESYRASLEMLFPRLPDPQRITMPIAVLGAEKDQIFSIQEVQATAHAYGVEAKIFPHLAHNMMSELGWNLVAEWIDYWAVSVVDTGVTNQLVN